MHARITRYKMKPHAVTEARALMDELKPDILGLPGMQHFVSVMNADGSGFTVSVVSEEGISPESVDRVRSIWHRFHDHLEEVKSPEIYEVVADWTP